MASVNFGSVQGYASTSSINGEDALRDLILKGAPIPSPREARIELYLATTALRSLNLQGLDFSYSQLEKLLKLCPSVQKITVDNLEDIYILTSKLLMDISRLGTNIAIPSILRATLTFQSEDSSITLGKVMEDNLETVNDFKTDELFRLLDFFNKSGEYSYICETLLRQLEEIEEEEGAKKPRMLSAKELARVIEYTIKVTPSKMHEKMQVFIEKLHGFDANGRKLITDLDISDLRKLSQALFSVVDRCERLYTLVADTLHRKSYYSSKGYPVEPSVRDVADSIAKLSLTQLGGEIDSWAVVGGEEVDAARAAIPPRPQSLGGQEKAALFLGVDAGDLYSV